MYKNYCLQTKAYFLKVCFCLLLANNCFTQTNLVPNYSFEGYINCPTWGIDYMPTYWYINTNKGSSYFNSCSNDNRISIPNNWSGGSCHQYARTGNAYIGFFYRNNNDMRAYVQVKLSSALKLGKKYYAEHYVNKPEGTALACNNIAMLFTNTAVYIDTINYPYGVLPANPQIVNYGNPVITDTMNWVKVSGVFKATGGEQYLTLGNFKYDANTIFKYINPNGYYGAVYNIDDVAVYELDSFNLKADAGRDSTIHIGDSVFIGSLTNGIDTLKWQNQNTGIAIDSIRPGFWVHPLANTCYVLTQTVNGYTSSDTVCITVQPLPLKFISYTLRQAQGDKVENIWQTANEINVSHFNILKSIDGINYKVIGKVKANNKSYNEYGFTDNGQLSTVDGSLYYKIESVDFDGRKQYSETRTLNFKPQTLKGVSVYPNPSKYYINILSKETIKEVSFINQLGQVIQQLKVNNEQLKVDISNISKGLYLLKIITQKNVIYNEKLIVE